MRLLKIFVGLAFCVGLAQVFMASGNQRPKKIEPPAKPQQPQTAAAAPPEKPAPKPSTDTAETREKLVNALVEQFNPAPAGWAGFAVRKVELKNVGQVAVTLNYSKQPSGYPQVQADTKKVVRACLKWIQEQGHDPAKEWITVTASAHLPEKGETGKDLVRIMGRSIYNFNNDQIDFKKDANLW
jgi:hypothetical protein